MGKTNPSASKNERNSGMQPSGAASTAERGANKRTSQRTPQTETDIKFRTPNASAEELTGFDPVPGDHLAIGYRLDITNGVLVSTQAGRVYANHATQPLQVDSDHLLTIPKKHAAAHTIIVAQSGSGKSYFLGTYLEELLLRTSCRMTILDPNADFRLFRHALHVHGPGRRFLRDRKEDPLCYTEATEPFSTNWTNVAESTRIVGVASRDTIGCEVENIGFTWNQFSLDLLVPSGTDTRFEYELLHDFLAVVYSNLRLTSHPFKPRNVPDYVAIARTAVGRKGSVDYAAIGTSCLEQLQVDIQRFGLEQDVYSVGQIVAKLSHGVSDATVNNYAKSIEHLMHKRLLVEQQDATGPSRVLIVDIPSMHEARLHDVVVLLTLDALWRQARASWNLRVMERAAIPTKASPNGTDRATDRKSDYSYDAARNSLSSCAHFIVIDEAHNLVPDSEPTDPIRRSIRDRINQIAAEGRKFGLYLLLVSQRPDKVEQRTLSECTNQAIMRTISPVALDICERAFGTHIGKQDRELIRTMFTGGARLSGGWVRHLSGGSHFIRSFGRRTMEGGVNIDETWMQSSVDFN